MGDYIYVNRLWRYSIMKNLYHFASFSILDTCGFFNVQNSVPKTDENRFWRAALDSWLSIPYHIARIL